jgi:hypothetical protein
LSAIADATATSSALIPAIIAAVAGLFSAVLLAWVALRAQSAKEQLSAIAKLGDDFVDEIVERLEKELHDILDARTRGLVIADIVRRALREVLREYASRKGGRRWYDEDGD